MKIELAQQLFDKGFPFRPSAPDGIKLGVLTNEQIVKIFGKELFKFGEDWYYKPTLNELIAACGNKFRRLEQFEANSWNALGYPFNDDGSNLVIGEGKTDEEAVANLWLELNP